MLSYDSDRWLRKAPSKKAPTCGSPSSATAPFRPPAGWTRRNSSPFKQEAAVRRQVLRRPHTVSPSTIRVSNRWIRFALSCPSLDEVHVTAENTDLSSRVHVGCCGMSSLCKAVNVFPCCLLCCHWPASCHRSFQALDTTLSCRKGHTILVSSRCTFEFPTVSALQVSMGAARSVHSCLRMCSIQWLLSPPRLSSMQSSPEQPAGKQACFRSMMGMFPNITTRREIQSPEQI